MEEVKKVGQNCDNCESCRCGCGCECCKNKVMGCGMGMRCGFGGLMKYRILRLVVLVLVVMAAVWIGTRVGELRMMCGGGYGSHGGFTTLMR